jgi:hypothetical protein
MKKPPLTAATYFDSHETTDPETSGRVSILIFKHENGGIFGIDSSFIEDQPDELPPLVADPFNLGHQVRLEGYF